MRAPLPALRDTGPLDRKLAIWRKAQDWQYAAHELTGRAHRGLVPRATRMVFAGFCPRPFALVGDAFRTPLERGSDFAFDNLQFYLRELTRGWGVHAQRRPIGLPTLSSIDFLHTACVKYVVA
jgi:hypothetical protein